MMAAQVARDRRAHRPPRRHGRCRTGCRGGAARTRAGGPSPFSFSWRWYADTARRCSSADLVRGAGPISSAAAPPPPMPGLGNRSSKEHAHEHPAHAGVRPRSALADADAFEPLDACHRETVRTRGVMMLAASSRRWASITRCAAEATDDATSTRRQPAPCRRGDARVPRPSRPAATRRSRKRQRPKQDHAWLRADWRRRRRVRAIADGQSGSTSTSCATASKQHARPRPSARGIADLPAGAQPHVESSRRCALAGGAEAEGGRGRRAAKPADQARPARKFAATRADPHPPADAARAARPSPRSRRRSRECRRRRAGARRWPAAVRRRARRRRGARARAPCVPAPGPPASSSGERTSATRGAQVGRRLLQDGLRALRVVGRMPTLRLRAAAAGAGAPAPAKGHAGCDGARQRLARGRRGERAPSGSTRWAGEGTHGGAAGRE